MARKAANGEGTIIKLKSGKWRAAIFVPLPSGNKKRKYHVTKTQREAKEWLTQMRADIAKGKPVLASDIPLGEYLEYWFKKYGSVTIRDSTKANYIGYIKHVKRHKIKDIPLKNLTTDDLQDFIIFLQTMGQLNKDKPLSNKTLHNIMTMIHNALQHAVGTQLICYNPSEYVQLPKVRQNDIRVLNTDEIHRLVSATEDRSLRIALILMLFCGLRLGECCALTHDDVHCENGIYYLCITKSLNRVKNFEAKEGEPKTILKVADVKSRKSNRQIPLLTEVTEQVIAHMAWQNEQANKSYGMYEEIPYLVSNEFGHFIDTGTVRKKLKAIAEKVGIDGFHPHVCRSTYASQAIMAGITLRTVSELLGHESTNVSERFYISTNVESKATELNKLSLLAQNVIK